jgi:hypothetical protein
MNKTIWMTQILALLVSSQVFAGMITLNAGTQNNDGVNISLGGTATIAGRSYDLTTVSSGMRKHYVLIKGIRIYVLQLMVDTADSANFVKDTNGTLGLDSVMKMKAAALHLSFVYDVSASDVQTSFKAAMQANKVDTTRADIAQFLQAVVDGGNAHNGKTIVIMGEMASDTITYEDNNGTEHTITGSGSLVHDIFSIWLGTSADRGLSELREELL